MGRTTNWWRDLLFAVVVFLGVGIPLCRTLTYTNHWAVRINGGSEEANAIASKYGYRNLGQIGSLRDYYHFYHSRTMKRSTISSRGTHNFISMEPKVEWIQQQIVKKRIKRDFKAGASQYPYFNDPKWPSMWYIHCNDDTHHCQSDMNIVGAWRRGYTGRNVVITILDDGIERNHPDLQQNYDQMASFDVNGNDWDPMPRYDISNENKHGTRCAGEVAAVANNSHCTIGVAFNAKIGGVRMLDGDVTDMVEAKSLSLNPQHIDIYSASWGPDDDGKTVDGPASLAIRAFENGIQQGRRGLGSIYVWASGNGGRSRDHCSCDGYTNSIYTISISSTAESGKKPWYLEECSSTLATTYSSGESYDRKIITTDLRQRCTDSHTGTSASAPMAAGIIALALEANSNLNWRDVQHIIVKTSRSGHLNAPDWKTNGAGYRVSHLYGFGLMDAEAMVEKALHWKTVPAQHICIENPDRQSRTIRPEHAVRAVYKATGCSDNANHYVNYLEHIIVRVTIAHPRRGDLSIYLTSPSGTKSQLLSNRLFDHSMEGFKSWEFMTTHCWGEKAAGDWLLEIHDNPSQLRNFKTPGKLKEWSLVLHGTSTHPYACQPKPRSSPDEASEDYTEEQADKSEIKHQNFHCLGPCDIECQNGCEGPGPHQCIDCVHYFLKFKNNTRTCVPQCPRGFFGDEKKRCKKCWSICESCIGSRSDQCTSCKNGYHLSEETNSCIPNCLDRFYLDKGDNVCRRCSEGCRKCSAFHHCTECMSGWRLQGAKCVLNCETGTYFDSQSRECERCPSSCTACAGPRQDSCTQCIANYYLEEWRCVSSCSSIGYYTDQPSEYGEKTCRRCDPSCLTCIGHGERNCSSCRTGYNLEGGLCVVGTVCKDGEYIDDAGKCHHCHSHCVKCSGPGKDECISCAVPRVLDNGICATTCPPGKFVYNGQCHPCHHTCKECVRGEPNDCTSCDKDKVRIDRYLFKGECREYCPSFYYPASDHTCKVCSGNCEVCVSNTDCKRCTTGYYLTNEGCQELKCKDDTFTDRHHEECVQCETGCEKCLLDDPTKCKSCTDGFYMFHQRCYSRCPSKTYETEDTMECKPCNENCTQCDDTQCYWCETGFFSSDFKCVTTCTPGYYGNKDSATCDVCPPACSTCHGPVLNECDSCKDPFKFQDGMCTLPSSEVCEDGHYWNAEENDCLRCSDLCKTCTGEGWNECTSCPPGLYLANNAVCVTSCRSQTFANSITAKCERCEEGCEICSVNKTNCQRCIPIPQQPRYLYMGRCLSDCPQGHFKSAGYTCAKCDDACQRCEVSPTNCQSCVKPFILENKSCQMKCSRQHYAHSDGLCKRCPMNCETCNGNSCTECSRYFFFHNGTCLEDCPRGWFQNTQTFTCSLCNSKCSVCDGPDSDDCEECADPLSVMYQGRCLDSCPDGTYIDAHTKDCQECDKSCNTCNGPHSTDCIQCRNGFIKNHHENCVMHKDCALNMYMDQICRPCHKKCRRCYGPTDNDCLSCTPNHFLLNKTCGDSCPDGYYTDRQHCYACNKGCETCSGPSKTDCLACKSDWYKLESICVKTCGSGRYGDPLDGICKNCHRTCKECWGSGIAECQTCANHHFLLKSDDKCYIKCPRQYYEEGLEQTCERCHPSCKTCDGEGPIRCTSCFWGFKMIGSICSSHCFAGEYLISEDPETLCDKCDDTCLECKGPGPFNCTDCHPNLLMNLEGGNCLKCCRAVLPDVESCCDCEMKFDECILRAVVVPDSKRATGKPALFVTASVLLILCSGVGIFFILKSRSKTKQTNRAGYEKLSNQPKSTPIYNACKDSISFQDNQAMDYMDHQDELHDEDDDDDIVYMGQDGTVYRKFKYGLLEDDEDELEYDDESYSFR
ncbi:proprotein convertase subtilisin/kexin type 5 isoform X1 [Amblyraja radiata]|uniref:proprotein convertase subtilisin/kexin type 5 isoform X1 n=1 Tax=Amblyraja radiata TaxID=386614 RepID=UPI001401F7B0|nr:proprotein convertase subtilisin/kexin type 5 isoform X1 [Amblyraja radiata]